MTFSTLIGREYKILFNLSEQTMNKINYALIVEDDPGMRHLTQIILKNLSTFNTIQTSSNGLEALEAIKNNGIPDYIFLDIAMPCMNGIEFLEAFQKNYCDQQTKTKIIILSSYEPQYFQQEILKYQNVTNYILKPLTKEKVNMLVFD